MSLEQISPHAAIAVIASEDQQFPFHAGFDFNSIREAVRASEQGKKLRGASTISQQVAKNLFLWSGHSFVRKGLEAYFTVLIEALWPKERILEMYLNIAQFGDGIYGVQAAAQRFWHKPARSLSSAEAALLAAVLPNPHQDARRPALALRAASGATRSSAQMRDLGGAAYLQGAGERAARGALTRERQPTARTPGSAPASAPSPPSSSPCGARSPPPGRGRSCRAQSSATADGRCTSRSPPRSDTSQRTP